ncbi:MAG: HD domain-containing protein, partial [Micrococcales bacterium]|nr:HD domain-containing protein [Micrococcales bacterium]
MMVGKTASTHALRRAAVEVLRNTALKDLGAVQLAQALQYEAHQVLGMSGEVVSSAIDLASIVHAAQKRGKRGLFAETPYIEHPLRNAVRLLRWGCRDQDVVVAAVLHDTIEDGAQQFVSAVVRVGRDVTELQARAMLSDHIKNAYGPRVLNLVEAVTNDYTTDTQKSQATVEERNQSY